MSRAMVDLRGASIPVASETSFVTFATSNDHSVASSYFVEPPALPWVSLGVTPGWLLEEEDIVGMALCLPFRCLRCLSEWRRTTFLIIAPDYTNPEYQFWKRYQNIQTSSLAFEALFCVQSGLSLVLRRKCRFDHSLVLAPFDGVNLLWSLFYSVVVGNRHMHYTMNNGRMIAILGTYFLDPKELIYPDKAW
jgi:hypothetical protein